MGVVLLLASCRKRPEAYTARRKTNNKKQKEREPHIRKESDASQLTSISDEASLGSLG